MKKTILMGSAALVILGLLSMKRNKKANRSKVLMVAEVLLTRSALKMLHSAKRAAIKEFQVKA